MPASTPVAVFVYKRPRHAERLLESLSKNSAIGSVKVHIFCDGPKDKDEAGDVESCRCAVGPWAERLGAEVHATPVNLGLSGSIVGGVSRLCEESGRAIVLEEDLLVRADFLSYMLSALDQYEGCKEVFQIAGYSYPFIYRSEADAYFLPVTSTWGWATWARAWRAWDRLAPGCQELLDDPKARKAFNVNGGYPYDEMLSRQLKGEIDSWGILWYYAVSKAAGLALWPVHSLVWNSGADGSGTHGATGGPFNAGTADEFLGEPPRGSWRLPSRVETDPTAYGELERFLRSLAPAKRSLLARASSFAVRKGREWAGG
jgi:hypothetical protein